MPSERDLGVMLSFESMDKKHKMKHVKLDAGFFNGPGVAGTTDFDSYKDFISRLYIKPYIFKRTELSGGISFLRGGWQNGTKYVYNSGTAANGDKIFVVDSSSSNLGSSAPAIIMVAICNLKFTISGEIQNSEQNIGLEHNPERVLLPPIPAPCPIIMEYHYRPMSVI
jgi:hypothetical protein